MSQFRYGGLDREWIGLSDLLKALQRFSLIGVSASCQESPLQKPEHKGICDGNPEQPTTTEEVSRVWILQNEAQFKHPPNTEQKHRRTYETAHFGHRAPESRPHLDDIECALHLILFL